MVHPDAKHWFVNSNFHKTNFLSEFLNDAMTYAMVSLFELVDVKKNSDCLMSLII